MKSRSSGLRCLAVWLTATALAGAPAVGLLPDLRRPLPVTLEELLVRVAEWAVLGCVGWLWAITTVLVLEAARRSGSRPSPTRRIPGAPPALRRAVLAACGVAVVGGLAAPATAGDIQLPTAVADGLADRFDQLPSSMHLTAVGRGTVVVRPGDSLWRIAAARLGPGATAAEITAEWHRIYATNRATVGSDPDLIEPGQRLRLPKAVRDE